MMRFARLRNLSQELVRALQEDAGKVSDGDIEDYYKKNEASYEQATLARIYIPKAKQIAPAPVTPKAEAKGEEKAEVKAEEKTSAPLPPTEEQKKAAEEAMTKVAADLRARAVKGEDPEALQKEAWVAAGLKGTPPSTKMENKRRATLPPNQQAVMDLKPGEVSEVITDPAGFHYVYKMISKETIALDTVKQDIQRAISRERLADSTKGFQGNVDLNNAYFTPVPRPGIMGGRMAAPPAQAPKHD
jgi:parvulin-like peptidyl-prolyl isomerase